MAETCAIPALVLRFGKSWAIKGIASEGAWCGRYPTTVATLSRRCRDLIEQGFEKTVDMGRGSPLLGSRLHDFGFRGCTCVEQSILGGTAHLLNFDGTDTLSAAYYAQVGRLCLQIEHAPVQLFNPGRDMPN